MENYFNKLNAINVQDKVEKKNGLSYLSWAYAWGELKKIYPNANYTVYENSLGWNYFTDGKTCWVKTGVTVNDIEHIEYLPVMDYRNKSIEAEKVTSFDINKTIQRSLTKAVARHGLGLYIYAGEDLPEEANNIIEKPKSVKKETKEIKQEIKTKQEEPKEEQPEQNDFKKMQTKLSGESINLYEMIKSSETLEELSVLWKSNKAEIIANTKLFDLITEKGKKLREAA